MQQDTKSSNQLILFDQRRGTPGTGFVEKRRFIFDFFRFVVDKTSRHCVNLRSTIPQQWQRPAATLRRCARRSLLVQELAVLQEDLRNGDVAAIHRLSANACIARAACRFCGVAGVAAAATDLQGAVRCGGTAASEELASFLAVCDQTREVLRV